MHTAHDLTHVWQAQRGGRWYLPLMRHPFCRYRYRLVRGRPFHRYGMEQQAEIVRHAFLLRRGRAVRGAPPIAVSSPFCPSPENLRDQTCIASMSSGLMRKAGASG